MVLGEYNGRNRKNHDQYGCSGFRQDRFPGGARALLKPRRFQLAVGETHIGSSTDARHSHVIGMLVYARVDFEKYRARGEKIKVSIVGMFMITSDTPTDLVGEVIESITVYGIFQVSDAVRAVLTKSGKLK